MSELCTRFHLAVELIGRRWSGAVIKMLLDKRARYAELRASIPEISDRMLSERLRELEQAGIVVRTVIPETPVRVEYDLTEKGRALEPALDAIGMWAARWVEGGEPEHAPAERSDRPARTTPRRSASASTTTTASKRGRPRKRSSARASR